MRDSISGEEAKIHSPVFAMLHKMRMGCKGVFTRVFQDEKSLAIQNICVEYKVRKLRKTWMIEGRISKNDIEGLDRFLEVLENICPDDAYLIHLHGPDGRLNKLEMLGIHFDGKHRTCSSGGKFI